jgi:hypothetical protein
MRTSGVLEGPRMLKLRDAMGRRRSEERSHRETAELFGAQARILAGKHGRIQSPR